MRLGEQNHFSMFLIFDIIYTNGLVPSIPFFVLINNDKTIYKIKYFSINFTYVLKNST